MRTSHYLIISQPHRKDGGENLARTVNEKDFISGVAVKADAVALAVVQQISVDHHHAQTLRAH